jgi:hypothetical protein
MVLLYTLIQHESIRKHSPIVYGERYQSQTACSIRILLGSGDNGEGIPATGAQLSGIAGMVMDLAGNLYVSETGNERVRKIASADGKVYTVAGP